MVLKYFILLFYILNIFYLLKTKTQSYQILLPENSIVSNTFLNILQ